MVNSENSSSLSKWNYFRELTSVLKQEKAAIYEALKDKIFEEVAISNDGYITLADKIGRFSNFQLSENVRIKIKLLPYLRRNEEYIILSLEEYEVKARRLRIEKNRNFFALKTRERKILQTLNISDARLYSVEFLPESFAIDQYLEKIDTVSSSVYEIIYPSSSERKPLKTKGQIETFYCADIKSNPRQVQAIEYILGNSSFPFPYVIFGPPGTGKSTTVAEAILQIINGGRSKVLVCAPSNAAVDVITNKLIEHIPTSDILRIASKRLQKQYSMSKKVKAAFKRTLVFGLRNAKKRLVKENFKVVLCTAFFVTLFGNFTRFSHVFFDEAGFSSEAESLLTLAPFLGRSVIVLSGDHNQFGPVFLSKVSPEKEISMMERLLKTEKHYFPDSNKDYNPVFITKLLENYRSDPELLEVSSNLFYDGQLIPRANPSSLTPSLKKSFGKTFPFIFIDISGKMIRSKMGTSLYNPEESTAVSKTIRRLLNFEGVSQSSIAIISPYKSQVIHLENMLHYYKNIEIGSPEQFQGREKDITVISTVRGNTNKSSSLGFLTNPKRFNVAITRARLLCIVIGDKELLVKNSMWKYLINYIEKNGGMIHKKEEESSNIVKRLNNLHL